MSRLWDAPRASQGVLMKKCTSKKHHHSRDRRFCYWRMGAHNWGIRDNVTLRGVGTTSLRRVRIWMNGCRVLTAVAPPVRYSKMCRPHYLAKRA